MITKSVRFKDRDSAISKRVAERYGVAEACMGDDRTPLAGDPRWDNDRERVATGSQVHCPRQRFATENGRIPSDAAIAYIRKGPHDIRPDLLSLAAVPTIGDFVRILAYCRAYLRTYCERVGFDVAHDLQSVMSFDALKNWLLQAFAKPQNEQAKELHIGNEKFAKLYGTVAKMLRRRCSEAVQAYVNSRAGTQNVVVGVLWNSEPDERISVIENRMRSAIQMPDVPVPAAILAGLHPHTSPTISLVPRS
jgi:hypothetical protein